MTIAHPPKQIKRILTDDDYPTSDGKPMAETPKHLELMIYFIEGLKYFFAKNPQILVAGNNFLYWEEGAPEKRISPDCYVVFGVDKTLRDSYMSWKEDGHLPSVIFEITSRKTRKEDTGRKFLLYEQTLRVPEYILFDPTGSYLKPRLQGYRLKNGKYDPIPLRNDRLYSEQLGLDIVIEGEFARLYDPVNNITLLTPQEYAQRAQTEAQRAQTEALARQQAEQRAENAEAEIARLRAQIEALQKPQGE